MDFGKIAERVVIKKPGGEIRQNYTRQKTPRGAVLSRAATILDMELRKGSVNGDGGIAQLEFARRVIWPWRVPKRGIRGRHRAIGSVRSPRCRCPRAAQCVSHGCRLARR